MKIKRYFAPDIRQAIRRVREEQGPDAVILSNQRVRGGVELVAAVDYDEQALRGAEPQRQHDDDAPGRERPPQDAGRGRDTGSRCPPESIWSQEPTLLEMRAELNNLRRMLENQLSCLAWGNFARHEPQRVELIQRLLRFGLNVTQCRRIADAVSSDAEIERMWHQALARVADEIPMYEDDLLNGGGIVALVGPTGVGKTTTAAKIAARYAIRHGSRHVALVTIDNYRVGAYEQLRTYGRILDVPVKVAADAGELRRVLEDLCDRRLVLIDTAGMGQHDRGLSGQAGILDQCGVDRRSLLLLSATTSPSGLRDVVSAFGQFSPDGCIVTKIDEATCLGGALSVAMNHDLPIAYVCDGQRVPEDLHPARAHTLVARGVEIMGQTGAAINDDLIALSFGKEVANAHF